MTFEFGINYWPKRTGFWMWREFDIEEVRDDMAHIAAMGFDVVRMFALTEDFLTGPRTVDSKNVERLVEVARGGQGCRAQDQSDADRHQHEWPHVVARMDARRSGSAG
jgi:endo-1,4-beta-mannosidase